MMSQVKAKKKLHYYQGHEIVNSDFKVNEILSLRDIDNLFDDIDADSELGLPLLSPLPKSTCVNGEKKSGSSSDVEKMTASPKKVSKDTLIQENGIEENEIMDKENPLNRIAPIKTSSPIALETASNKTVDGLRPVADPLLFGVEDEEPIGGDLSKPSCTQQSEPTKESIYGDSVSLESPPEKLDFRKTNKSSAGSLSSMKTAKYTKTSVQATKSPEKMEKEPSKLSLGLVEEGEAQTEQCKNQVVEDGGKGLSFQHKLKKALMPKSPNFRKQAAVSSALPPADLEEDFMILDDEAPVLFRIPRKAEVSRNKRPVPADTAKENVQLSQSETDLTNQQEVDAKRKHLETESGKQKTKGKRGKASKKSDSVTSGGVENEADPVTKVLEDKVCEHSSPQTEQRPKAAPAGKKRTNSKALEPAELSDKDETDKYCSQEIQVHKQEGQGSKAKKVSNKVSAATDLPSTKSVKSNKNRRNSKKEDVVSKTKKQAKKQKHSEQEHPSCYEQEHEPPPALTEQEEEQRTVNQQSLNKEDDVGPGKKQKRKGTKKVEPKPKDPPTVASDISSDSPLYVKRMRKPPGEWWLTSPNESTSDIQPNQVSDTSQGPKASTKTSTQKAAAVDSESLMPAQGNQKKAKTQNVLDSAKKVKTGANGHDAGAEKKTAKKAGGRRKLKPVASRPEGASQSEGASQAHVSGEGACLNENDLEMSPEFSSPKRKHNVLTGEKRVFDSIYARDAGSARKQPSSSVRRPEISEPDNIHQKRQRKAPSNWWEAQHSEEPANELPPPSSPPPQKSNRSPKKVSNTPLYGVLDKDGNSMKSQKSKNHTRNIKRNIYTPKSIKRSLASMNAIYASEESENMIKTGQRRKKQGRRNLLHSLEDQSDHSSENMAQSDDQLQGIGRASFGFTSGVTVEPSAIRNQTSVRVSSGPNTLSDVDIALRSGPSSMIDLQRHDEDDDIDLPSSRVTSHVRQAPRVLVHCDLCGPPLQPVVLEEEDWNNLHAWFSHLWPPASKNGRVISPDDFHWHSHGGRAMGHMVDLQSNSFSHGKILLGSFMKKPAQVDLDTIESVFSVISSCVRVDIEGVKSVHNSGQVFMIPSGQMYSIHNLCQEPAVLIYHRTQSSDM